jgi:predicted MFS family arabinose efflux permease
MLTCDIAAATAAASVPLAWTLGVLTLPHLGLLALVAGVCAVFFRTAYVKLLPLVVKDEHLEPANARLFGTESAAQVAGPGVAGMVAQAVGAALGLLLDAVSFAVSAVCLARVRPGDDTPTPAGHSALPAQIREGVAFLRRDTPLRWFTALGGLSNLGLTGYAALLVLFLVREAHVAPAQVGLVLSLGSLGGLLGAAIATPLAGRLGSGRASTLLLVCSGPPALLVPLGGPGARVALTVLGLFLVGLCVVAGNVVRGSWIQRYIPRPLMGRVTAARQVVNFGAMPLAGLLAGVLGSSLGIRPAMTCLAAVHAVAGLSILVSPLARLQDLPTGPGPAR